MGSTPSNQQEFEMLRDEYLRIFDDQGPAVALDFINGLGLGHNMLTAQIRAAAFTDCGTALRSPEIVACGEGLWRRLRDRTGSRGFTYNLANALLGRWEVDLRGRSDRLPDEALRWVVRGLVRTQGPSRR